MTKIKYNQEYIDHLTSNLNKISTNFNNAVSEGNGKYVGSDTLYGGINRFRKNLSVIGHRAQNASSIINKQGEAFIEGENQIEKIFDSIEIPKELKNIYSPLQEIKSNVELNKNDGKAVNSSDNTSSNEYRDSYTEEKESLESILKEDVDESKLLDNYKDNNTSLSSIVGEDPNKSELEDNYDSKETNLSSFNEEDTTKQDYEEIYDMNKEQLEMMTPNDVAVKLIDEHYKELLDKENIYNQNENSNEEVDYEV